MSLTDLDDILDSALEDFDKPDVLTKPADSKPILGEWHEEDENKFMEDLNLKFDETLSKFLEESGDVRKELDEISDGNDDLDINITETMEKLLKSQQNESSSDPPDDVVPKNPEAMMGMLESLLGTLLSKDVLYEPLRELRDLYPAWLRENKSHENYENYDKQKEIVINICAIFEAPDHKSKSDDIYKLLCDMQDTGAPPSAIIETMSQDIPESLRAPPPTGDSDQCTVS